MAAKDRQGVLGDMFDADTRERLEAATDPDEFELLPDQLDVEYSCPRCGYGWRGNPKPPTSGSIDDAESTDG